MTSAHLLLDSKLSRAIYWPLFFSINQDVKLKFQQVSHTCVTTDVYFNNGFLLRFGFLLQKIVPPQSVKVINKSHRGHIY